jgi:predicted Zn-dependent peptidase
LSNGIRVCSERTNHQTVTVGVYAKAGSRNEDLETTGSAYLLEKMLLRGSTNSTKNQISEDIENLGAKILTETGREISRYTL